MPNFKQSIALGTCFILLGAPVSGQEMSSNSPICGVCTIWTEYEEVLNQADQEVAPLADGAVYFYSSDNFRVMEALQRFAYARLDLHQKNLDARHPRIRMDRGHTLQEGVTLEITTSAHGFFALLRSENEETVAALKGEAMRAVRGRTLVRF